MVRSNINVPRVKRFIKHLSTAQARISDRDSAKVQLQNDIISVKELAKGKNGAMLGQRLQKIEDSMIDVLNKEINLLRGQSASDHVTNNLKSTIEHMEHDLISTKQQDLELISQLRKKIETLSEHLKNVDSNEKQMSNEVKELLNAVHKKVDSVHDKIDKGKGLESIKDNLLKLGDKIQDVKGSDSVSGGLLQEIQQFENKLIDIVEKGVLPIASVSQEIRALDSKLNEVLKIKWDRDKKVEQIEEKIKQGFGYNEKGIMQIEEQIAKMEGKFVEMKSTGKLDEDSVKMFHNRIKHLKNKSKSIRFKDIKTQQDKLHEPMLSIPEGPTMPMPSIKHPVDVPLPEPPTEGLEFSTKGELNLSPDMDIPPPPDKIHKKSFFTKLSRMFKH